MDFSPFSSPRSADSRQLPRRSQVGPVCAQKSPPHKGRQPLALRLHPGDNDELAGYFISSIAVAKPSNGIQILGVSFVARLVTETRIRQGDRPSRECGRQSGLRVRVAKSRLHAFAPDLPETRSLESVFQGICGSKLEKERANL